jgi:hypothetical protein
LNTLPQEHADAIQGVLDSVGFDRYTMREAEPVASVPDQAEGVAERRVC